MSNKLWAVRGVSEEVRRAAKSAAARAGATLGAWLENAIAKQCGRENAGQEKSESQLMAKRQLSGINSEVRVEYHSPDPDPPPVANVGEVFRYGQQKPEGSGLDKSILSDKPKRGGARNTRKKKRCRHGTEEGFNCGLCGGLAVMAE